MRFCEQVINGQEKVEKSFADNFFRMDESFMFLVAVIDLFIYRSLWILFSATLNIFWMSSALKTVHAHACACVCVCGCVCACVGVCVCVWERVYVWVGVLESEWENACMCMMVSIGDCAYIYLCVSAATPVCALDQGIYNRFTKSGTTDRNTIFLFERGQFEPCSMQNGDKYAKRP